MAERRSLPRSSLATQRAARRPPTGAIPALRPRQRDPEGESPSPGHLCLPLPKPEQDAKEPAALSPYFLSPLPCAVWKGSWEPSEASGGGGARPRLPLESAASLAQGKFFKVPSSASPGRLLPASRRRQARQPPRRRLCLYCHQQRALRGSLARGKRAGLPAGRSSSWDESRS